MDERFDARVPPPMERLGGPKLGGGAFRRIPILPVVALVMFFLGLAAGSGLASKTQPVPSGVPSGSIVASASLAATLGPTAPPTPPTGSTTMGQALVTAKAAVPFDDTQIVSVTLIDDPGRFSSPDPEQWIWEIVVEAPGVANCWLGWAAELPEGAVTPLGSPGPSASNFAFATATLCLDQTAKISVEYHTGEVVSVEFAGSPVP